MTLPILILIIVIFTYVLFVHRKSSKRYGMECMAPGATMPKVPKVPALTESADRSASKVGRSTKNTQAKNFQAHEEPLSDDYHEYMVSTGLESSIVDSHKVFTKDIQTTTTGASAQTVFSHDDDIVPKWGLRRTSPLVPISAHAREVPSSTNEQIHANATSNHSYGNGLF